MLDTRFETVTRHLLPKPVLISSFSYRGYKISITTRQAQGKAMQCKAEQSKAKQNNAKKFKTIQNNAKQSSKSSSLKQRKDIDRKDKIVGLSICV